MEADNQEVIDVSLGRIDSTGEYLVEDILDTRLDYNKSTTNERQRLYLVKWKFWPSNYNTWENVSNLVPGSEEAIQRFWKMRNDAEIQDIDRKWEKVLKTKKGSSLPASACSSPDEPSTSNISSSVCSSPKVTNTSNTLRFFDHTSNEGTNEAKELVSLTKTNHVVDTLPDLMDKQVEKIYGVTRRAQIGKITFLIKWKNQHEVALVDGYSFYQSHPKEVEEWLQSRK